MAEPKQIKVLTDITDILLQVSTATPIVGGAILAVTSIVRAFIGRNKDKESQTLLEKIDILESKIDRTDAKVTAEMERLKGKL